MTLTITDLDALPVIEQTGAPYASTVKATDVKGAEVGVMHACGHDMHITAFLGTARVLCRVKTKWHGTVIMIGQPAEERVKGAKASPPCPHPTFFHWRRRAGSYLVTLR